MSILQEHVLVLNKGWKAIGTCTVADSFSKLFAETAEFLDAETYATYGCEAWLKMPVRPGDRIVRTAHDSIRVPEILIMLTHASPKRVMRYSRKNIMRRDAARCQYCGSDKDLTIDHIFPRKKGGKSGWKNCVACCFSCNSKKADRTLAEAEMRLLPRPELRAAYPNDEKKWAAPYEPSWSPTFRVPEQQMRESWLKFLTQTV